MSLFSRLVNKAPGTPPENSQSQAPPPRSAAQSNQAASSSRSEQDIAQLGFGDQLLNLLFGRESPASQRAAQKRIAELIDAKSVTFEQLTSRSSDNATLLAIAAQCADLSHFEAAAVGAGDESFWTRLAAEGSSSKLRHLAAERVNDEANLRMLLKAARDKDKNVYRTAKGKLDLIHAETKRVEAERAHVVSLAETIERHSYKPFDGAFVASLEHLIGEWRAVGVEIADDTRTRVEAAIDRARTTITEHIRIAGAQAAHESAVANAEPLRLSTLFELRQLVTSLLAAESFDAAASAALGDRLTKLAQRWDDTLPYKPASRDDVAQYRSLNDSLRKTAALSLEHGTVGQQLDRLQESSAANAYERIEQFFGLKQLLAEEAVPEVVTKAELAVTHWRQRTAEARESAVDGERQFLSLVRKASQALEAGRSRQAVGIRKSIEEKLSRGYRMPKHVAARLEQLDLKLNELQDWKSFAVTPKRSELIEQMQALVGTEEEPAQLAERIKRLQEEWRSLAKGSTDGDADWEKFHQAAQAAYEPCRVHFEAQSKTRQQNLEHRKQLLARLVKYEQSTDWSAPDWKHAANVLRMSRQDWRSFNPTERAATKPVEQAFDALHAQIQQRVDGEYTRNVERKQSLIRQASQLATVEDAAHAADEVKRLQSAWRDVGIVPQAQSQSLWDEFKQNCDAVFAKRRQQHTELVSALGKHREAALALCAEAEAIAMREGDELTGSAARLRELRTQFDAIEELPRDSARDISRRFDRALKQFDTAVAQQRANAEQQKWRNLFAAVDTIRLHELARIDSSASNDSPPIQLEGLELPSGGLQALQKRIAQPLKKDTAANEAALRVLCVRAELLTDTPTPAEDQAERRAIQLQALVSDFGHARAPVKGQLDALIFDWIGSGPIATERYEALFNRFGNAVRNK